MRSRFRAACLPSILGDCSVRLRSRLGRNDLVLRARLSDLLLHRRGQGRTSRGEGDDKSRSERARSPTLKRTHDNRPSFLIVGLEPLGVWTPVPFATISVAKIIEALCRFGVLGSNREAQAPSEADACIKA